MSRPYTPDQKLVSFAYDTIKSSETSDELRRGLCIVLSSELNLSADNVAQVLTISRSTVFRYRDELENIFMGRQHPRENWGGRRYNLLTEEEEYGFLNTWKERALKGELIDVRDIHNALVETVGHPIALASTYNLLHRNNWRKVKPDTCHPKGDPEVREEFKKKSHFYWKPLSKKKTN